MIAYADLVRLESEIRFIAPAAPHVAEIEAQIAGVSSEKVVVVLGAAHAAAIMAGDVDRSLEATLPPAIQSQ